MMTIAIMTMFFLPATFFATIFAMPILGWDEEHGGTMMMPQMWLYVELALPVTTLIFVIWGLLTCWRNRRVRRREQDRKERMVEMRGHSYDVGQRSSVQVYVEMLPETIKKNDQDLGLQRRPNQTKPWQV
jgi:membrane protein implicated in regulation of membrane protease activity